MLKCSERSLCKPSQVPSALRFRVWSSTPGLCVHLCRISQVSSLGRSSSLTRSVLSCVSVSDRPSMPRRRRNPVSATCMIGCKSD